MGVSKLEVGEAILSNNTSRVVETLEEFCFFKDDRLRYIDPGQKELVSTMLSFASIKDLKEELADELAYELIERTAIIVQMFSLLELVVIGAEIQIADSNYTKIPNELREALTKNDYKPKVAEIIEGLDENTFKILIAYIIDEIETLNVRFTPPIIKSLYKRKIIPNDLLLAFMAISLRDPETDALFGVAVEINDFLDSVLND